jgi:NADPH:quinone reductase-like Zn-dependent oxidoreductase
MPGMTGYFGLLDVGQPKPGETVVVSGAAGAVGQTVGQVAKIKGCRAVGIAGGKAKCDFVVNELHYDACIDYKGGDVKDGLKAHCAKGVDVYFDNVGGEILDTVLTRINRGARIVICGAISQYNNTTPVKGHGGVRLRRPLCAGGEGHRAVDARGEDGFQGRRGAGDREFPRDAEQAVQRGELRQAGAKGRGRVRIVPAARG